MAHSSSHPLHYYSSVNRMKSGANWFRRGQLEKMFILFPDPHFKRSNFRRRIVNPNFLGKTLGIPY
jgi:tRNA G46 methylase TrmB